jgi:hypothetical protein
MSSGKPLNATNVSSSRNVAFKDAFGSALQSLLNTIAKVSLAV